MNYDGFAAERGGATFH